MIDINELKFDEKGLIPAIVVDAVSKKVLTLAYMNRESVAISLEKELTCFWSRSRQELWLKGETSGNYQHLVSVTADCDKDALLVLVEKDGPACHLGTDSCFSNACQETGKGCMVIRLYSNFHFWNHFSLNVSPILIFMVLSLSAPFAWLCTYCADMLSTDLLL